MPSTAAIAHSHDLQDVLKRTLPDWQYSFREIRHWLVSMGSTATGVGLVQVAWLVGHRSAKTTARGFGHLQDEGSSQVLDTVT